MMTLKRTSIYVLIFIVLAGVFHYPLFKAPLSETFYGNHDDVRFFLMVIAWTYHSLSTDIGQLFHAPIFFPKRYALCYSETLIGEALLGLLFFFTTQSVIFAYNCVLLLSVALTGLATFLLVKELFSDDRVAFICGLAMLSPPEHFSELAHIQSLQLQWTPLALFFMLRIVQQGKWRWSIGLIVSLVMLAYSNLYFAVFLFMAMMFFGPVYLVLVRRMLTKKVLVILSASLFMVALLISPLLNAHLNAGHEIGFDKELAEIDSLSADIIDYLSSSSWFYFNTLGRWMHSEGHFPGVVILLFSVIGLIFIGPVWGRMERPRRAFFIASLLTAMALAFISFGPTISWCGRTLWPSPFPLLYEIIPGLKAIRALSRLGHFTYFFTVILAGFGLNLFFHSPRMKSVTRPKKVSLFLMISLAVIIETMPPVHKAPHEAPPAPNHDLMKFLRDQPAQSGVLHLPVFTFMPINSIYEWWATFHWQPIIFAHSSNYPPDIQKLAQLMMYFPSYQSIGELQAYFPVKFIVLHENLFSPALFQRTRRRMADFPMLDYVTSFGPDHVYRLERTGTGTELVRTIPGFHRDQTRSIKASINVPHPFPDTDYIVNVTINDSIVSAHELTSLNNYALDFSASISELLAENNSGPDLTLVFSLKTAVKKPPPDLNLWSIHDFENFPLRLEVTSQPMRSDGLREAVITVNGYAVRTEERGMLCAKIDPGQGVIIRSQLFDTHADRSASAELVRFFDSVAPGEFLVGAVSDEASAALTDQAEQSLSIRGIDVPLTDYYRHGLAFIAWKMGDSWMSLFSDGPDRVTVTLGPDEKHFQLEIAEFTQEVISNE